MQQQNQQQRQQQQQTQAEMAAMRAFMAQQQLQMRQMLQAAQKSEEDELQRDMSGSVCMICMELVYEPANKGCCTYKVCRACLVDYKAKNEQGRKNKCMACRQPLSAKHRDPVVVDESYWQLVQKLFPVTVAERRKEMQPALNQGGAAAAAQSPAAGQRLCKCKLPAVKMRPAKKSADPDKVGRFYYICPKKHAREQGACSHFVWGAKATESQRAAIHRFTF
jgi:hypothetical protein